MMPVPVAMRWQRHPQARVALSSSSSQAIERDLENFEIEAGVTYLDNEPLSGVTMQPLFSERYFLLTRKAPQFEGLKSISWAQAAKLPLCLLTPDMQNRRIAASPTPPFAWPASRLRRRSRPIRSSISSPWSGSGPGPASRQARC